MARMVVNVDNIGVRLDWLDQAIKRIHRGGVLRLQFQKMVSLKIKAQEAELFPHQT